MLSVLVHCHRQLCAIFMKLNLERLRSDLPLRALLICFMAAFVLSGCGNKQAVTSKDENLDLSLTGVTLDLEKARDLQAELPCVSPIEVVQESDNLHIFCRDSDGIPDWSVYADLTDKDSAKGLMCPTQIGRYLIGPNWTSFPTQDEALLLKLQTVLGGELFFGWQICDPE